MNQTNVKAMKEFFLSFVSVRKGYKGNQLKLALKKTWGFYIKDLLLLLDRLFSNNPDYAIKLYPSECQPKVVRFDGFTSPGAEKRATKWQTELLENEYTALEEKNSQLNLMILFKLVGPVDNRPSTVEAPPIRKIHPFSKIAVTLEPVMQFRCPSRFRISYKIVK